MTQISASLLSSLCDWHGLGPLMQHDLDLSPASLLEGFWLKHPSLASFSGQMLRPREKALITKVNQLTHSDEPQREDRAV